MISNALTTERFYEYLNRNAYTDDTGALIPSVPSDCLALFKKFPSYEITEDLTLDFYEMFKEENYFKEIGAETEQLFTHYLRKTLQQAAVTYIPKIEIYFAKFNQSLLDRKISLQGTETTNAEVNYNAEVSSKQTGSNTVTDYLNPTIPLSENEKPIIQGEQLNEREDENNATNKREQTGVTTNTSNKEMAYSWFKSNPELLEQVMDLKNIYIDCLHYFDKLFMYTI